MLQKVNDNAYILELPPKYSNVSATFNIKDLLPYVGEFESRMTPSQEGEADEDIPSIDTSPTSKQNAIDIVGPITRQRAKQLEKEINAQVNANLSCVTNNVEDSSTHSGCCFIVLRNDGAYESAWNDDNFSPQVLL